MFNVVLIEPEIPPNTGNIGRLCLATGSTLHLVKPLGFSTDDRELKRAGLDYWKEVDVRLWDSFDDWERTIGAGARIFFLTTKSDRAYYDVRFRPGDFLVFGRETKGLPEALLAAHPESTAHDPDAGHAQPESRHRGRDCPVRSGAPTAVAAGPSYSRTNGRSRILLARLNK